MAVKRVVRLYNDESSTGTLEPGSIPGGVITKAKDTWAYWVTMDNASSCAAARNAEGVAELGFQHPDDTELLLTRKSAVRAGENIINGEWYFRVTCDFDSSLTDAFNNGEEGEALSVKVDVSTEIVEVPTNISVAAAAGDYADKPPTRPQDNETVKNINVPVANSAGDLVEPMPVRRIRNQKITFTVKTRSLELLQRIDSMEGSINTDTCTITQLQWDFEPGDLISDAATYSWDPETELWTITWTIVYSPLGWKLRLADAGYYYWQDVEGGTKIKTRFKDGNGLDQVTQGWLDGKGKKLDINPDDPKPVYRSWWMEWGESFQGILGSLQ